MTMKGDKVKFGVVVFPGSNCDHDAYHAVKHVSGQEVEFLWHKESNLRDADVIILPGGFSYGDYLRCGAISQFSSIMKEVVRFANDGGYVIGICNGFQILTETGLLKGALLRNASLQFVCKTVELSVANASTAFSSGYTDGEVLRIPVAHGEGNFYTDRETLKALEDNRQVVFRYSDNSGNPTRESNPNGSVNNIAGIINEKGNVLGMMPHPERAMEHILGSIDGLNVFESLVSSIAGSVPASA